MQAGSQWFRDALAALAYDATNLLLRAISRAGVDNTDKVRLALEDIDDNAVTGRITYDSQHNPEKPGSWSFGEVW